MTNYRPGRRLNSSYPLSWLVYQFSMARREGDQLQTWEEVEQFLSTLLAGVSVLYGKERG